MRKKLHSLIKIHCKTCSCQESQTHIMKEISAEFYKLSMYIYFHFRISAQYDDTKNKSCKSTFFPRHHHFLVSYYLRGNRSRSFLPPGLFHTNFSIPPEYANAPHTVFTVTGLMAICSTRERIFPRLISPNGHSSIYIHMYMYVHVYIL